MPHLEFATTLSAYFFLKKTTILKGIAIKMDPYLENVKKRIYTNVFP